MAPRDHLRRARLRKQLLEARANLIDVRPIGRLGGGLEHLALNARLEEVGLSAASHKVSAVTENESLSSCRNEVTGARRAGSYPRSGKAAR